MIDAYYKAGIKLIPLKDGSKEPLGSWDKPLSYEDYPKDNINCGVIAQDNGLVILDIDTHNQKDPNEGFKSLVRMEEFSSQSLPETMVVETPSGGQHFYFKLPDAFKNDYFDKQVRAFPSVDFQTGKAYVVGAGSVINGEEYTIIKGSLDSIVEAPDWLMNIYKKVIHHAKPKTGLTKTGALLTKIIEGTDEGGRNIWLTSIAGTLFRQGMRDDVVKYYVYLANSQGCKPPLPRHEVDTIYQSIKRSEARKKANYTKGSN